MTSAGRDASFDRGRRPSRASLVIAAVVVLLLTLSLSLSSSPPKGVQTLFGDAQPETSAYTDSGPVELGVSFTSEVDGLVSAVRFHKGPGNVGPHVGTLWSAAGVRLATTSFGSESASGWQTAAFADPVKIVRGETYVASYRSPSGSYSAEPGGLDTALRRGDLSVPVGGGVFTYEDGGFPSNTFQNSNYFVDVDFQPARTAGDPFSASPSPTTSGTSSAGSSTRVRPPEPTQLPEPVDDKAALALPRVPWEGGPEYWKQFSKADKAGWDDPSFFPVVVWYNGISSDAEAQYDKRLGINTYIGMWPGTPYQLFADNDLFWIGGPLNKSFNDSSKNWVGDFLDDEVDGRFTPSEGRAHLQRLRNAAKNDGRFKYANFTQSVMSRDMVPADAENYVNDFTDAVSIDMYWYTIPYCHLEPYRDSYLTPVSQGACRSASSYGSTITSLRARDAVDGKLQPLWQFVENVNGGPGEGPFVRNITPGQLKGAVMNSVIHEARGIVYFNQSFTGPCQGSALFRQAQMDSSFCAKPQVDAARDVNMQIKKLAPVLNTQSYVYSFGADSDTMLKGYKGSAYIFAMVEGGTKPGQRTFQLPDSVKGKQVEVLFERRSLMVDSAGRFQDEFAAENSYHIYKVKQ